MLAVGTMSVAATASDPVYPGAVIALVLQIAQFALSAARDQRQQTFVLAGHRPAERSPLDYCWRYPALKF